MQLCLAAAVSLVALTDWGAQLLGLVLPARTAQAAARLARWAVLAGVGLLALSRSAALVLNYGAPLTLYRHLPEVGGRGWAELLAPWAGLALGGATCRCRLCLPLNTQTDA